MKIENNVLKHYLKNVYFITGTAYAGKSTTVKMLAKRYGMVCCGENYHMAVSESVATPQTHPNLCYNKSLTDWPVDDCSIAIMKFPNGVNGKVLTSIGCKRNYTMRSVFYGTRGTIICDNKSSTITLFEGEEIHPASGTRKFTIPQLLPVAINHHNTDEELAMFLDAVLNQKEVAISAMEGAKTVAVCEAVVKSCECGMPIQIEYPFL